MGLLGEALNQLGKETAHLSTNIFDANRSPIVEEDFMPCDLLWRLIIFRIKVWLHFHKQ
jgi:hypothetical protein